MRVVHLLPAMEQGGVESVVRDLNRVLVGAGVENFVVSRGGRLAAEIERAGGRHFTMDLKSKNPLTYFARALRLRRLLRDLAPDLVCAHSRVPAWLFVWANRTLRLPWITYAHGANSVSRYSAVMTRGDRVVTPSRFLADFLKAHYPLDEDRLRVIHPAVDTKRFDPANLDASFVEAKRREWGLRDGDRVRMALGRITPVKGLDALIRELPDDRKLVIVGGADRHHLGYEAALRQLAADRGVADRVVFAGPQAKVPECLSLADEVVSGNVTKPESFGLSVAEAYAMDKPVLARRFGGVAEIMSEVEACGAISRREAVISLYNYGIMLDKTMAVYRELVK